MFKSLARWLRGTRDISEKREEAEKSKEEKISSQGEQARVEEVIDGASGKIYLPPCQIACPI